MLYDANNKPINGLTEEQLMNILKVFERKFQQLYFMIVNTGIRQEYLLELLATTEVDGELLLDFDEDKYVEYHNRKLEEIKRGIEEVQSKSHDILNAVDMNE